MTVNKQETCSSYVPNYNDINLEDARAALRREKEDTSPIKQVYTMAQANSPCEVKVTKASRKICIAALLK